MTDERMYKPSEYRRMVRISSPKYILVEGQSDKRCLMYLIEEIFGGRDDIKIHGAYQILSDIEAINREKTGNREKVEAISQKISKSEYASRFVGFVDREWRGFALESEIKDLVGKHNIIDRLVWSRGHSIENYFFDYTVLARPLRHHSVTLYYEDALDLFKQHMEQILRVACAIGLAAWKCNLLKRVRGSIADWNVIKMGAAGISLNTEEWLDNLTKKHKMEQEHVLNLKEAFQEWSIKVAEIDFTVVRWLCDGHIGFTFIWTAFARCVFEVCQKSGQGDPRREAISVFKSEETVRFNACAGEWAFQVGKQSCEYPVDIFSMLGIA